MEIFRPALSVSTVLNKWPLSLAVAVVQDLIALGLRQPRAERGGYQIRVQYLSDDAERALKTGT